MPLSTMTLSAGTSVFFLGWLAVAAAWADTAPGGLAEPDRRMLESALGPSVVGPAVDAIPLSDPKIVLAPEPGPRHFRILVGPQPKHDETHQFSNRPSPMGPAWRYRIGDQETELFLQEGDGDVVVTGVNDHKEGVATRYDPPKPLLPKDLAPGEERRATSQIQVFDLKDTSHLLHSGSLDVVVANLGTYRVTIPAGEFEAILIRSATHGRVGPAKLEDVQYYFFAPKVGNLASVQRREVKAFGIYNSTVREARVLAAKPELAGAP
jgi:hypothetical protein